MIWFVLIFAYLIGSIPFGYILTKIVRKTDIRSHGSGNIGATNILRVIGWKAAIPVLILDMLKGIVAVLLAKAVSDQALVYLGAGLLAMIGHSFPVYIGFKGGKAVATAIGVLAAISWLLALVLVIWTLLIVFVSRYMSLGSVVGSLTIPILFWVFKFDIYHIVFGLGLALLIVIRHLANIGRLLKGTEPKLGKKI